MGTINGSDGAHHIRRVGGGADETALHPRGSAVTRIGARTARIATTRLQVLMGMIRG